jgi:L-ascorbate metabolism protein UlaG (beta-lactamase superfamily)
MKAQHMNPDDAVQAFLDLGARRFFAMHWGTFKLTDEWLGDPPVRLARWFEEKGHEASRLWIMKVGETRALTA